MTFVCVSLHKREDPLFQNSLRYSRGKSTSIINVNVICAMQEWKASGSNSSQPNSTQLSKWTFAAIYTSKRHHFLMYALDFLNMSFFSCSHSFCLPSCSDTVQTTHILTCCIYSTGPVFPSASFGLTGCSLQQ